MYVPTSVPGHRSLGVGITVEVTVLGEHSLLALVVGKEAARPGLSQPIWFSSLARSLGLPQPRSFQDALQAKAGPSHSPGRTRSHTNSQSLAGWGSQPY